MAVSERLSGWPLQLFDSILSKYINILIDTVCGGVFDFISEENDTYLIAVAFLDGYVLEFWLY